MNYDAFLFVHAIRERPWLSMLAAVETALMSAERWPAVSRRAGMFHPGDDAAFRSFLHATRDYLLKEGRTRPDGLSQDQFLLLKPLCRHLVDAGRFPEESLRLFEGLDAWNVQDLPVLDFPERKDRA